LRRIGHKGADAIVPGNTLESFRAAVEHGVDMIELDVLRVERNRLVIAHDFQDAVVRRPLSLDDALDAFRSPPLDTVDFDLDLKVQGEEAKLVDALRTRDLLARASVSTMEIPSLVRLGRLEPELRLGWTYPKIHAPWDRRRWATPGVIVALAAMRQRLPYLVRRRTRELGLRTVWPFHVLVTPRLIESARVVDVEVNAWTVDDPDRIRALTEMGVDGICTNDPRLFASQTMG
jgi:glycerophosphoryl diester phosphodiesterase